MLRDHYVAGSANLQEMDPLLTDIPLVRKTLKEAATALRVSGHQDRHPSL